MEWVEGLYIHRHWMAHGYVIPWKSTEESWHFIKHEFQADGSIKDLERFFTMDELLAITSDLTKLAMAFAAYVQILAGEAEKHFSDNRGS